MHIGTSSILNVLSCYAIATSAQPKRCCPYKEYTCISQKSQICPNPNWQNRFGILDAPYKKQIKAKSSHLEVFDIVKWFKRSGVEDLSELSSDVMKYVIIIKDMLLDALRMKWQDLEMLTLEYYIAICKY